MVRRCQGQTLIIHIIYALLQIWITSKMWPMDLRGLDGYESALEKGRESAEALGTYIDLWVFFLAPPYGATSARVYPSALLVPGAAFAFTGICLVLVGLSHSQAIPFSFLFP